MVSATLRRVGRPALDALRLYPGSAILLVAAATGALLPALPITGLLGAGADTRLVLPTLPGWADSGLAWTDNAVLPDATRAQALQLLFHLLLIASVAVLLVAVITIASLSAARAGARAGELAVRRSVGGSRRTLTASAALEGLCLGLAGVAIGVAAGMLVQTLAVREWPGGSGPTHWTPAAVTAGATGLAVLAGALLQLLALPRRRLTDAEPRPLERGLPALQLGMSLTVLVGSAMLARHARDLTRIAGPAAAETAGHGFHLRLDRLDPAGRSALYGQLLDSLHHIPGVASASLTSPGAQDGMGGVDAVTTDCGRCSEGGIPLRWHLVTTTHHFVSADSFHALGMELVAGRALTPADTLAGPPVVVISEGLARRHFEAGHAVGRQLRSDIDRQWYRVVGVVRDRPIRAFGGGVLPTPTVYFSILQQPIRESTLAVAGGDPRAIEDTIRQSLGAGGAASPGEDRTVTVAADVLAWFGRWFGFEGWAMAAVAAIGTLVLMRIWVLSLYPELGLRRAAGATRGALLGLVLRQALVVGVAGLAIALWFGPALWDSLPDTIRGLGSWDLRLVAPTAAVMVGIALAGALWPAWQATRMTPAQLINYS